MSWWMMNFGLSSLTMKLSFSIMHQSTSLFVRLFEHH